MRATKRLYWEDDHAYSATATVVGVREDAVAFDQTCFYPGGGGQPPDCGTVELDGAASRVNDVKSDANGVLWHCCDSPDPAWQGRAAVLHIDELRRVMLSRYHTVLHLVNTIALRNYGAWITGAQIDVDYARIDFKWEGFSPSLCSDIETKVNAEIATARSIRGYLLAEQEFTDRPELLRTLEKRPPVIDGCVRAVEIHGFDAQACGGTHVASTAQLGRMLIERTENKGRINKRLYVRLT